MKINENQKRYNKKIKQIKTLTKKALKNKFKYKPCKGFTFLKDVKKGNLIKINGFLAIILKSNDVSSEPNLFFTCFFCANNT